MDGYINSVIVRLRLLFWIPWAVSLLVFFSEMFGMTEWMGLAPAMVYLLNNLVILFTVVSIPVSLRLLRSAGALRMRRLSLPLALAEYYRWSRLRILITAVVSVFDMAVYAAGCGSTGALCSLMVLLSSFIVYPRRGSLESYLDICDERSGYDVKQ